jgi:UDP-N-acetyl-D-mannosaminuronate dehydrogenase
MLPGSTQHLMQVLATRSGRVLGQGLHVAYNPEFLREGTAVRDFYAPPYTFDTLHPLAFEKRHHAGYQMLETCLVCESRLGKLLDM